MILEPGQTGGFCKIRTSANLICCQSTEDKQNTVLKKSTEVKEDGKERVNGVQFSDNGGIRRVSHQRHSGVQDLPLMMPALAFL